MHFQTVLHLAISFYSVRTVVHERTGDLNVAPGTTGLHDRFKGAKVLNP